MLCVVGGCFFDYNFGSFFGIIGIIVGISFVVNGVGVGGWGIVGFECRMDSYYIWYLLSNLINFWYLFGNCKILG